MSEKTFFGDSSTNKHFTGSGRERSSEKMMDESIAPIRSNRSFPAVANFGGT